MFPPSLPEDLLPFIISLLHHSSERPCVTAYQLMPSLEPWQQPVLLSLKKHTPLPFICLPFWTPRALSVESGQKIPGLGLYPLSQQGPSVISLWKAPWCTKTSCILGLPLHPPSITLCKIETVCGTCMFHSFKKVSLPPLPLSFKCLYKFLFKQ